MRRFIITIALIALGISKCNAFETYQFVKCEKQTAVLIKGTESPDGLYSFGWTIVPNNNQIKPVDWKSWNMTKINYVTFMNRYLANEVNGFSHPEKPILYNFYNCLVDLKAKRMIPLRDPSLILQPPENHPKMTAIWSAGSAD